jgi:ferric-dicitrate binding protein FerR (iron transport regulator)
MTRPTDRSKPSLERLVEEVRDSAPREVNWPRVESELLARLAREPQPRRSRSALWGVGALAAAAAAGALAVANLGEPARETKLAPTQETFGHETVDTVVRDQMAVLGRRFVAGRDERSVRHAGIVEWTLSPGSSAEVMELSPSLVVQLQSGEIEAEVVPSTKPESFVVEVGRLRVAVHGTVFQVRREGDNAFVSVSEGVVAVGAIGQRPTTLMRAPAAARFVAVGAAAGRYSKSSGRVKQLGRAQSPTAQLTPSAAPSSSLDLALLDEALPDAGAEGLGGSAALPSEPTLDEVERGLANLESLLGACLAHHTGNTKRVELSLKTRMALKVAPNGNVGEYRFTPPLEPKIAACVQKGLDEVRFVPSISGAHIIRDLEITR